MNFYRQNRHNQSSQRGSAGKMFTQAVSDRKSQNNRQHTTCLRELTQRCWQGHHVKIICKGSLLVSIIPSKGSNHKASHHKRVEDKVMHIYPNSSTTLQSCLDQIKYSPLKTYIFSCKNPQPQLQQFRTSENISCINQRPLKPQGLNIEINKNYSQPQNNGLKHLDLNLQNKNEGRGMFTVEEVKDSQCQGSKQSFGKENENGNVKFYWERKGLPHVQVEDQKNNLTVQFKQKEPVQLFTEEKMVRTKEQDTICHQKSQFMNLPSEPQSSNKREEPRFSFAEVMKKGILRVQKQSIDPLVSFKIAGDQQIENQKYKAKRQIEAESFIEMSQLSSIISTTKEQAKKQSSPDSLKHEIDNINECVNAQQIQKVEKVNLTNLAEQRQESLDSCIHIEQNNKQKDANSQYTVHYDLRFLKRKNSQTQVIRLSPLRFRKKQQLVSHFVQKKSVDKQSHSIEAGCQ